jgi:hypothetical protein
MHEPDEGCTPSPGARLWCAGLGPVDPSWHRVIAPSSSEVSVDAPLYYTLPARLFGRRRQEKRHPKCLHQGNLVGWAVGRPDCEDQINKVVLDYLLSESTSLWVWPGITTVTYCVCNNISCWTTDSPPMQDVAAEHAGPYHDTIDGPFFPACQDILVLGTCAKIKIPDRRRRFQVARD